MLVCSAHPAAAVPVHVSACVRWAGIPAPGSFCSPLSPPFVLFVCCIFAPSFCSPSLLRKFFCLGPGNCFPLPSALIFVMQEGKSPNRGGGGGGGGRAFCCSLHAGGYACLQSCTPAACTYNIREGERMGKRAQDPGSEKQQQNKNQISVVMKIHQLVRACNRENQRRESKEKVQQEIRFRKLHNRKNAVRIP